MRDCAECGSEFEPRIRRQRCCSSTCGDVFRRKNNREDARQRTKEWRIKNPNYVRKYQKKIKLPPRFAPCKHCGNEFQVKTKGEFCTRSCQGKHRRKTNPEWYRAAYQKDKPRSNADSLRRYYKTRVEAPWNILITAAKVRAKKKGIPFSLTSAWACSRWTGRCEITKLNFAITNSGRNPFSPSIDQIRPSKGYTQDNCRFILWSINAMKGAGTDEDVLRIAQAIVSTYHKD